MTPAQLRFARRMANKNDDNSQPISGSSGLGSKQKNEDNDPVKVLEKHSCSVFLPHT